MGVNLVALSRYSQRNKYLEVKGVKLEAYEVALGIEELMGKAEKIAKVNVKMRAEYRKLKAVRREFFVTRFVEKETIRLRAFEEEDKTCKRLKEDGESGADILELEGIYEIARGVSSSSSEGGILCKRGECGLGIRSSFMREV